MFPEPPVDVLCTTGVSHVLTLCSQGHLLPARSVAWLCGGTSSECSSLRTPWWRERSTSERGSSKSKTITPVNATAMDLRYQFEPMAW